MISFLSHKSKTEASSPFPNSRNYQKVFKQRVRQIAGKEVEAFTGSSSAPFKAMEILKHPLEVSNRSRQLVRASSVDTDYVWYPSHFPDLWQVKALKGISWYTEPRETNLNLADKEYPNTLAPLERSGWSWLAFTYERNRFPSITSANPNTRELRNGRMVDRPPIAPELQKRLERIAATRQLLTPARNRELWLNALEELFAALFESAGWSQAGIAREELHEIFNSLQRENEQNEAFFHTWCDMMDQFRREVIKPFRTNLPYGRYRKSPQIPFVKACHVLARERWSATTGQLRARASHTEASTALFRSIHLFLLLGTPLYEPLLALNTAIDANAAPQFMDLHTRKLLLLRVLQQMQASQPLLPVETLNDILAPLKRDAQILRCSSWEEIDEPEAKKEVEEMERRWGIKHDEFLLKRTPAEDTTTTWPEDFTVYVR